MRIPVLHNPNPELRVTAQEVKFEDIGSEKIQSLIDNMLETMVKENGVGLAATQVGEHLRIFVAETNKGQQVYINPEIIYKSDKIIDSEEGCLSVPGYYGTVKRHKQIKATAYNRHGEKITISTGGLLAVIFQHEINHLDGILFIDIAEEFHKITENSPFILD